MPKEKLVRDNIPDLIRMNGDDPLLRTAEGEELDYLLRLKILEEALELLQSSDFEEVVDVLEAVDALMKHRKMDPAMLEVHRHAKRMARGGFEKGIVLITEE